MSDRSEIHIENIRTKLRITIHDENGVRDVSDASSIEFIFTKSDGTKVEKNAEFVTDGSDGKVEYGFVSGDLNTRGQWRYQLRETQNSNVFYTDIGTFKVFPNL